MKGAEDKGFCKSKLCKFSVSFIIVFLTALAGSLLMGNASKTSWYQSVRPSITPPNYVFPIAWTILYIMIGFSLYFAWNKAGKRTKSVWTSYGLNLFFNAIWTFIYFGLKNPSVAFIDMVLILITLVMMLKVSWKVDKLAFWLLVPYLLWILFAGVLNFLSI